MKHIFTFLAFTCFSIWYQSGYAGTGNAVADTLYLRTREKKLVEIKEVYPDQVKYKPVNGKNLVSLPINDIAEIIYNNGVKDVFNPFNAGKPEIRWLTNIAYSDKPEVRLNACVVNEADKVQIEVNGALTTVATRSFKTLAAKEEGCPGGIQISQQIALKEGKNSVRLMAGNGSGDASSETLSILYEKAKKRIALVESSGSASSP